MEWWNNGFKVKKFFLFIVYFQCESMISKNKVPCSVAYFNQQTKRNTRLSGEIDEEKWFKFKKIVELLLIKKLNQKK